ncbi:MAG: hypothetical protein WAP03_25500 [Methylorubrum rhodinum]|uniref:hypothetical protein n=1 Tax=Methylorubrum rhodinum TaxID=29428 RepID=UPI003BB21229
MTQPVRCVHYVGFRDDRYLSAWRVFRGPRVIHRRWDRRALREIGPEDIVVFAEGDDSQPFAEHIGDDIEEKWL